MEMGEQFSDKRNKFVIIWVAVLAVFVVLVLAGIKFQGKSPSLEDTVGNLIKKNEVLSEMKVNLLKSVEAEKSAVLADTDEASQSFADQSLLATAAANEGLRKLDLLIEEGGISDEKKLLGEFDRCWAEFRKIDKVLLDLAVQNTNIKAVKLSYTEGGEAMSRFEQALTDLIEASLSSAAESQIVELALKGLSAGHKIHYLQAPHIVASSDEKMDELEADMRRADEQVRSSLNALDLLVGEEGRASLMAAQKAYAEFVKVNAQVIDLSRKNTNIMSMELSLGKKRKVTAQCQEILGALQEAVRSRTFKATR
jgi:hypothetical protein